MIILIYMILQLAILEDSESSDASQVSMTKDKKSGYEGMPFFVILRRKI